MAMLLRAPRVVVVMLLALALGTAIPGPSTAATVGKDGKPITNKAGVTFGVLSHRGGALEWPENSVEAYTKSVAAGFDSIEADIMFTRDGRAVMNHNEVLPKRCTSAGKHIHDLTYAQVSKVRCENLAGDKVVPIPTFEQLAAILKTNPKVGLTLDIKSWGTQSAAGKRDWAKRAIQLVKKHGLLERTSILTFYWSTVLPTIRTYAKKTYVLALDPRSMDLDRVRLAAKLGADGYGIRMKYTSEYLARYVKSKGMDSVPWEIIGREHQAFSIYYGGKRQLLSSDLPTATRRALVDGKIELNPTPRPTTTTLAKPVAISRTTYKAKKRQYKVVNTKILPASSLPMLRSVTVSVKATSGSGKGYLYLGASSSPLSSSVKVALPKSGKTVTVSAPLGDGRKLRIWTTRTVKLEVSVKAFTRVRF